MSPRLHICNELHGAALPPLGTLPSPSWPGPGGGERQEAERWMRRNDADVTVRGYEVPRGHSAEQMAGIYWF